MLQRDIVGLPPAQYPADPWCLIETDYSQQHIAEAETVFSISNGYIGMRAVHEEGSPFFERGTFINGFHEQWKIMHPEEAYGFAQTGQTMIPAPDARRFHLYVDDKPLNLQTAEITDYERRLDFRTGILSRKLTWNLPSSVKVRVESEYFISIENRHLACMKYRVELLEGFAPIIISSQLRNEIDEKDTGFDPRKTKGFSHRTLEFINGTMSENRQTLEYRVPTSKMTLACSIDHLVTCTTDYQTHTEANEERGKLVLTADAAQGTVIEITKYASFHDANNVPTKQLADRCHRTLDRAIRGSYEDHVEEQRQAFDRFWDLADIEIGGNDTVQQAARWSQFQIFQNSVRADGLGVPAKGLTGSAYEGHYFWDTEIYVLPMLVYTQPNIARNLLMHRYHMLDSARKRAEEVNEQGALFPWRTITGEEASAYYEAGTAQYHINADIAYAICHYARVTGDWEFLYRYGAEILVETARMYAHLGHFDVRDGRFHIHGVTGPDEYTTVVDDNAYTNLMAATNLREAAGVVTTLSEKGGDEWQKLISATRVSTAEADYWKSCADQMFIPFDEEMGITKQDSHFLELQSWDFEGIPRDKYPLLLHFHPLVIYRHKVIKQADVVLAMFLHEDIFDIDQMKRNFDYYDPITTGDSSLSTSIQSIIASRIGNGAKAIEYFRYGVFMDLGNVAGNTSDGVHVAAAGGVWLSIVHGFGGLNDCSDTLAFTPRIPASWESLKYSLMYKGQRLDVFVDRGTATYSNQSDEPLELLHEGREVTVPAKGSEVCDITSAWETHSKNN